MATITKRGSGWYAQVRRKGFAARYATMRTKSEALTWARSQETELDGTEPTLCQPPETTLGELLERYRLRVTPRKRGHSSEDYRLLRMMASPMSSLGLQELRPGHIAAYRDRRLREVKPGTVRRELTVLRAALELARREWGVGLTVNPAGCVQSPVVNDARERRLRTGEWDRLLQALSAQRRSEMEALVRLAIETALRRGELLKLTWTNVELERRVAHIPDTKTGRPRTIPLTSEALRILQQLCSERDEVFTLSATAVHQAWKRACKRAGIVGLRFHDLRHEALSRFAELGLNTPELALISGHKDVRMLLRYTHVRPAELARKLAGRRWQQGSQSSDPL